MNVDDLHRLIAQGETMSIEFKGERHAPLNDRALVEAAACLANRTGADPGILLIGVEDDGTLTGARPRHGADTDLAKLTAMIANRTRPAISVRAESVVAGGRCVLVLEIPPQIHPIATEDGVLTRRALGNKAAYVHQRGFEPLQQEQMVLQYMEKHGKITRQDVAQLCRLSGPQAYRLLQRLVIQGLAEKVGERGRGVHYRNVAQ